MENINDIIIYVQQNFMLFAIRIVGAIATYFIGKWIARILSNTTSKMMIKRNVDTTLAKFLKNIVYFTLLTVTILAALTQLGVETTSFVAIVGAAGLAVGLALQGSLSNFAAGVMLILFRPIKVGDLVETADVLGVVEEISIFTTTLVTPDNKTVIVPNSSVTSGNITNYTKKGKIRVDMVFGIGYGDDMKKAKNIMMEVLQKDSRVLSEPAPFVGVLELGDSSVNFACRPYVDPKHYWDVYFDTHETVKRRFDDAGVSIPFPQRDVHVFQQSSN